ncbi:hypothetical protein CPB86DRAFT_824675 [Serendipita vermifera]|nr:hypothetical protein CPB86DRAFT_824675 [Serendipita vermifera]
MTYSGIKAFASYKRRQVLSAIVHIIPINNYNQSLISKLITNNNMSNVQETYGRGGAGNFGTNVNHGIEGVNARIPTENTTGRGGFGNISEGPGHYDTTGGHETTGMTGRGGFGNAPAHETHGTTDTVEHAPPFKATTADKVIGSAQVAIGKMTKNGGLIDKGIERKRVIVSSVDDQNLRIRTMERSSESCERNSNYGWGACGVSMEWFLPAPSSIVDFMCLRREGSLGYSPGYPSKEPWLDDTNHLYGPDA